MYAYEAGYRCHVKAVQTLHLGMRLASNMVLVQVTFVDCFVSGNDLVTNMTAIHSPHHNGSRLQVF